MSVVLEVKNITKKFPGVIALNSVNMQVEKGKVIALLGENGAGKSTLMKILAGAYKPDEGEIFINGKKVNINDVNYARELGIGIVYQELTICPNLTVAANIFAMNEKSRFGLINDKLQNKETEILLKKLEINIPPDKLAQDLSISNQQMIEIAKVLARDPQIIIMDEPTSALSEKETKVLFNIIKNLKKEGKSIIFISHRMEEIFEIADCVTVFRDGSYIGTVEVKGTTSDELVRMMVGREMSNLFPKRGDKKVFSDELLRVENYTKQNTYFDISFNLKKGEILGIYGLMGAGRTEIAKGIFGIYIKDSGQIYISGKKVDIKNPQIAMENKIAFVTEDRKNEGLVLTSSVAENITMANIDGILGKFKLIDDKKEKVISNKYIKSLSIKTPSIDQTINNLSGGNQQKVVLAKWFEINPKILILDEPTRGIDVGAKYEIYKLIFELANNGVGVILISSELSEVLNLTDRILVVNNKRIVAQLETKETSAEEIAKYITEGGQYEGEN